MKINTLVRGNDGRYGRVGSCNDPAGEMHEVLNSISGEVSLYHKDDLEPSPKLKFKRLVEGVNAPKYTKAGDAGIDFHSAEEKVLQPKSKTIVRTGIGVNIPPGYYMRLSSRSGLSAHHSIEVGAGTIDETYAKELMVILYNHDHSPYVIAFNERICQGVILRYECVEIEEVDDLTTNAVRDGGLGESGRF